MAAKKVGKTRQLSFAFESKAAKRGSGAKKKVTKKAGKKGKIKKARAAKSMISVKKKTTRAKSKSSAKRVSMRHKIREAATAESMAAKHLDNPQHKFLCWNIGTWVQDTSRKLCIVATVSIKSMSLV